MPRTRGRARNEEPDDLKNTPKDVADEFDDEEDKPARRPRGRNRAREEQEEEPRSRKRSRRDDDDEDDEPDTSGTVSSGWGAVKANKAATSDFPDEFKVGDDEVLIAFLDDEPFTAYLEHFINEIPKGQKKSFVCHGKGDCPLCDMYGDKPASRAAFNIIDFTNPEKPELKVWKATPGPLAEIEKRADSKRTSPLNKEGLYFVVSKEKGKNNFFQYSVDPVKEDDIYDDFEVDPDVAADAIESLVDKAYDKSIVKLDSKRSLKEIAEGLLDED